MLNTSTQKRQLTAPLVAQHHGFNKILHNLCTHPFLECRFLEGLECRRSFLAEKRLYRCEFELLEETDGQLLRHLGR